MSRRWTDVALACLAMILIANSQANAEEKDAVGTQEKVHKIEEITVKAPIGAPGVALSPEKTQIDLEQYDMVGTSASVADVLKTRAIIDFRGDSDLTPGVDEVYLRGFEAKRFVTAIDGVTIQKTGGRKSSNIIDYALLPTFLVEKIEILPGPHSALYDSKSIGGVINLVPFKPHPYDNLKPEISLSTSYRSYNTQVHNALVRGGVGRLVYDAAYQKNRSDGYLRHNESDIDNLFGRLGWILSDDGFIALSTYYSDVDRDPAVNNSPEGDGDYDDDYPLADGGQFDSYTDPTWDGLARGYRLNYEQSLPVGRLALGAYYGEEMRDRTYFADREDSLPSILKTEWVQQGGKLSDEIQWAEDHKTTVGVDFVQMYDDGVADSKTERINKKGGFLQHQWRLFPSLDVKLGMRYEDVKVWVGNASNGKLHIPGREEYIERNWDQWVPKSFATWQMDSLADWLRETSLSFGLSKIWRAPDYHGDYNPQGRPAGAWIDPEHGIGYDVIFKRRLWGNFDVKINYAFYDIKDFIATNSAYAQFTPNPKSSDPQDWDPSLNYSDYKINLEEVYRHGVDLEVGGNLTETLSLHLSYAWQTFENKGDEPAGETELDQRAEHRINAGLSYAVFEKTMLLLDYYYQSEEVTDVSDAETDYFRTVENGAYHLVDIGVDQTLIQSRNGFKEVMLSLYVKNLFDETYYENAGESAGFPATNRTYGIGLSLKL